MDEQRAGPAYLKMPAIAEVVVDWIGKGGFRDYELHAWVVMPNHVDLLITPHIDVPSLLRRLKGGLSRQCNQLRGELASHWQDESYDRLVRGADEFRRIENYILQIPVRAGLSQSPEDYRWSDTSSRNGLKPVAG